MAHKSRLLSDSHPSRQSLAYPKQSMLTVLLPSQFGAALHITDHAGRTPLEAAAAAGHPTVIHTLLRAARARAAAAARADPAAAPPYTAAAAAIEKPLSSPPPPAAFAFAADDEPAAAAAAARFLSPSSGARSARTGPDSSCLPVSVSTPRCYRIC